MKGQPYHLFVGGSTSNDGQDSKNMGLWGDPSYHYLNWWVFILGRKIKSVDQNSGKWGDRAFEMFGFEILLQNLVSKKSSD